MPTGYCTLEDLRRTLREASLPGDLAQDEQIAVDSIVAGSEWLEKTYKRHWYEPDGIDEAALIDIPAEPMTRDDEHDLPMHGGFVHGDSERTRRRRKNSDALLESTSKYDRRRREARRDPKREIRIATGEYRDGFNDDVPAYTRITLERRDVAAVNELHVINGEGAYDDWAAESAYDGGVGNLHRGEDYWVRINNEGVSELYLDVHSLADDIASLSNAVYLDIDYGHEGIPRAVRRAVAFWAASDFVEKASIEIPDNATVYNIETKADEFERKAEELMEAYQ